MLPLKPKSAPEAPQVTPDGVGMFLIVVETISLVLKGKMKPLDALRKEADRLRAESDALDARTRN